MRRIAPSILLVVSIEDAKLYAMNEEHMFDAMLEEFGEDDADEEEAEGVDLLDDVSDKDFIAWLKEYADVEHIVVGETV